MCDLSKRRSTCHGSSGNWLKAVKLSKWELPIPNSKSYWEEVCEEIEKKYKKVRVPYSFNFSLSKLSPSLNKSSFSDEIKFKISPPSPQHVVKNIAAVSKDKSANGTLIITSDRSENINQSYVTKEKVNQYSAKQKKLKPGLLYASLKHMKIYPKSSCPRHKNTNSVKICKDIISKQLHEDKSSVATLPRIAKKLNVFSKPKMVVNTSPTVLWTLNKNFLNEEILDKNVSSKAPKLGKASMLPSFVQTVSSDDSIQIQELYHSQEEANNAQNKNHISKRGLLHVPNLKFVSSHPSFHKLSLDDLHDEDIDVDVNYAENDTIVPEAKKLRNSKIIKSNQRTKKKFSDYKTKYLYKALDLLTYNKYTKVKNRTNIFSVKSSLSSNDSTSSTNNYKCTELNHFKDNQTDIGFEKVHIKSKKNKNQCLNSDILPKPVSKRSQDSKSITISSTSRSTSGFSPNFDMKTTLVSPLTEILKQIPDAKIFQRKYVDKCHACLQKPFKDHVRVNHRLPLAIIKATVNNTTRSNIASSITSSSVEDIADCSNYEINKNQSLNIFNLDHSVSIDVESEPELITDQKSQLKVSFDESSVTADSISTELLLRAERSFLTKPQPNLDLKQESLSAQSSDRSKTSTPNYQSSDSEDSRPPEDGKLPSSKYMAPCHLPVIWRPTLEPLQALKLKKFTTLRQRAALLTKQTTESNDSESGDENLTSRNIPVINEKETAEVKSQVVLEIAEEKTEKKRKKPLVRMNTISDKMIKSVDIDQSKSKSKVLKRAKTTFDLKFITDDLHSAESEGDEDDPSKSENVSETHKKFEQLPYFDEIAMHRARSPLPPIMEFEEVLDIVKLSLQSEFSASELIKQLVEKFSNKIQSRIQDVEDKEELKYLKLGFNLFRALKDSRQYIKSKMFEPNLEFSQKQLPLSNPRQLRRILPPQSYDLVAPILGMPQHTKSERPARAAKFRSQDKISTASDNDSEASISMLVNPPTIQKSSVKNGFGKKNFNPYALFLKKPRRKAVVWRPLCDEDLKGYDPEATLEMRAARLMDKICKDFCNWLQSLGSSEQIIDEETLKDMFEINFTAEACKAMKVILKETPIVPMAVVKTRGCQEAGELEATRRQIRRDVKVEKRPNRSVAFNRCLPAGLRFRPPQTRDTEKWLKCDNIPEDLMSMAVVWDGITDLDSVRSFMHYLTCNPKPATKKLLKNYLQRRKLQPKLLQPEESIVQLVVEPLRTASNRDINKSQIII